MRRGEAVNTLDVAKQVGCTQPLVFQVIRDMKAAGEEFDHRELPNGRTTYRLLSDHERRERERLVDGDHRRRAITEIRGQVDVLLDIVDDVRRRLAALA